MIRMRQEDVWRGIDRLADEIGVTPARLARMAGLDQAVFGPTRRLKDNGELRWPSMDSLAKVLHVADISLGDFVNYMYGDPASRAGFRLPCLRFGAAGDEHYDGEGFPTGDAWDRIEFPDLQDPKCFGLVLEDDRASPVYREGDLLVCAPGMSIRRGDRIVYRHGREPGGDGVSVGVLIRQTPFRVDIAAVDESRAETLAAQDIKWMTRIAWVRQ
jgi:phage repressor protein C with HTH and peptisase S24 domain